MTFAIDADGKVDRVRMKPVSPLADFSFDYQDLDFTPVAAAAERSESMTKWLRTRVIGFRVASAVAPAAPVAAVAPSRRPAPDRRL